MFEKEQTVFNAKAVRVVVTRAGGKKRSTSTLSADPFSAVNIWHRMSLWKTLKSDFYKWLTKPACFFVSEKKLLNLLIKK
jgi:hypothetical protein